MCPSFKRASLLGVVGEETIFFLSAPLEMLFLNEVSISENCVPEMHLKPPKLTFFQLYLSTRLWIAYGGLYWSQKPGIVLMGGMVLKELSTISHSIPFRRTHGREAVLSILIARKSCVSYEQLMCFLIYGDSEFCYSRVTSTEVHNHSYVLEISPLSGS